MNRLVPAYALYGETAASRFPDPLHIETIAARSSIHDWRIRPHRHADLWQIFVLSSGGGVAHLDGSTLPLHPPLALVVPPLAVHGFTFAPGTQGHVVSIPADTLARGESWPGEETIGETAHGHGPGGHRPDFVSLGSACAPTPHSLVAADLARLGTLLDLAEGEFATASPGRSQALRALATLLALAMLRLTDPSAGAILRAPNPPARPRGGAQARLVQAFLGQVEADFRRQPTLADRARRLGVSVPHLSRACRAVLGRSALAVSHDRLLLEARRHLVYTSMTIQQIAYGLGFSDPAYFTRFFTQRTGRSPIDYRKYGTKQ